MGTLKIETEVVVSAKNCDRVFHYVALENMLSKKGSVVCGLSSQRGGRGLVRGAHALLRAVVTS